MTGRRAQAVFATMILLGSCSSSETPPDPPSTIFSLDRSLARDYDAPNPERTALMSAGELRLLFQDQLSETAVLASQAMRLNIDDNETESALNEIRRNADDLASTFGLIYGAIAATAFDQLWTSQIELVYQYSQAVRENDSAALTRLRDDLRDFETDTSAFLEAVTDGSLNSETALVLINTSVELLLGQADAWREGDYTGAFASSSMLYAQMDALASEFATAVADQQPNAFPGRVDETITDACVELRLSVGLTVSAAANSGFAQATGNDAQSEAAEAEFERARVAADPGSLLEESEVQALDAIAERLTNADDVAAAQMAARADALALVDTACERLS